MAKDWVEHKVPVGRFLTKVKVVFFKGRIYLKFPYNKKLLEATKEFSGRKWGGYDDPPTKEWSFTDNSRNRFRLDKMMGKKVFAHWDSEIKEFQIPERHLALPFWEHQLDLYHFLMHRKQCIIVGDMGTGKSRVAIAAAEQVYDTDATFGDNDFWFVGPVNAVNAVGREIVKWGCPVPIKMFTYDKLVSHLKEYEGEPPKFLILDEASKLKNWSTQRTKAVWHLTEAMRQEHGNDCYIIQMSGTPSPKAPTDWWSLAEIARPGFLKEATTVKLRNNLCLIEQRESGAGQLYPHIITWLDNAKKCATCGELEPQHVMSDHDYVSSKDMMVDLYSRLKGLVIIKHIDDCMDLPEMVTRIVRVKPEMSVIRAAKILRDSDNRAPQKLMLLRELSDGFQYQDVKDGIIDCPRCLGEKTVEEPIGDSTWTPEIGEEREVEYETIDCPNCDGTGKVDYFVTKPIYVGSPKDAYLMYLLEEYAEYGRFVLWAAFTASIDHLVAKCVADGWNVLKIDGRGVESFGPDLEKISVETLMDCMDYSNPKHDDLLRIHPKVLVIAHPKSGGMAYTFTSAPAQLYYGNDFNGEDKMQSMARIRRGGMHASRGVTTYEVIHLPEDKMTLDNLAAKKNLQAMTLNDLTGYKVDYSNTEMFDGEKYVDK